MLLSSVLAGALVEGLSAAAPVASTSSAATAASGAAAKADALEPAVPPRAWNAIVLHHSATSGGNVESIDAVHRRQRDRAGNPWLGIGYHFVVGNGQSMADGQIQPTFRWRDQLPGAHAGTRAENEQGIGICLIGNFDETAPTPRQLAAVRGLLQTLTRRYAIPPKRVLRHQDVQATLCPGRLFPLDQVLADVSRGQGS